MSAVKEQQLLTLNFWKSFLISPVSMFLNTMFTVELIRWLLWSIHINFQNRKIRQFGVIRSASILDDGVFSIVLEYPSECVRVRRFGVKRIVCLHSHFCVWSVCVCWKEENDPGPHHNDTTRGQTEDERTESDACACRDSYVSDPVINHHSDRANETL